MAKTLLRQISSAEAKSARDRLDFIKANLKLLREGSVLPDADIRTILLDIKSLETIVKHFELKEVKKKKKKSKSNTNTSLRFF